MHLVLDSFVTVLPKSTIIRWAESTPLTVRRSTLASSTKPASRSEALNNVRHPIGLGIRHTVANDDGVGLQPLHLLDSIDEGLSLN